MYADYAAARTAAGRIPRSWHVSIISPTAAAALGETADARSSTLAAVRSRVGDAEPDARDEVTLTEFDPDGELKVVATAALYAATDLPDDQLRRSHGVRRQTTARPSLRAYVGDRTNRRHKPGRAFERTRYRFDVLTDYGAFRDLQRHRLLTLEWQRRLTPHHGCVPSRRPSKKPARAAGLACRHAKISGPARRARRAQAGMSASYAVAMAYRVRFTDMNARRPCMSSSCGRLRRTIRRIVASARRCRAIDEVAGHRAITAAMQFADHSSVELERLQQERAMERKRKFIRTERPGRQLIATQSARSHLARFGCQTVHAVPSKEDASVRRRVSGGMTRWTSVSSGDIIAGRGEANDRLS